jgi:hypothetical protein
MDPSNSLCYIADLERHIYRLQQVLREWTPYVPQEVILRSQIPVEIVLSGNAQLHSLQDPQASKRKRGSLSNFSDAEETWRKPLRAFINKIPPAEKWQDTVSSSSPSVLEVVFQRESRLRENEGSIPPTQCRHSNILQTLEDYALLAQKCTNNAKWARLVASYQRFLLSALCHVACCVGVDPKAVNDTMGLISKGGPDHLHELRLGAAWGVEAIDRLQTESDWDIRSGDIFFFCESGISIYFTYS